MSETSPGLAVAWRIAATEAAAAGYPRIECAHLLMGIFSLDKATAKVMKDLGLDAAQMGRVAGEQAAVLELFGSAGASPRALRRDLRSRVKRRPQRPKGLMSRSTAAKAAFARAEALAAGQALNSLHLLSVLLRDPDPVISSLLVAHGLGPDVADRAEAAAMKAIKSVAIRREPTTAKPRRPGAAPPGAGTGSVLARFGRDITAQARAGEIGPVIGREAEIRAVLETLSRPNRNTPLLVGEAGVGKTAIVEGVALRGVLGKEPVLGGKRIVELNLASLLGDAGTRGGSEQRMRDLQDDLRASGDVILFIRGIHAVVGAHRAGSIHDAANSLKQVLARGEVRVIGTSTPDEFRRNIEKDAAMDRRFEKIDVKEPAPNEALEILRGLKGRFEQRHGVEITDGAFESAVSLSVRFDPEGRLPGKAVDLIDGAAALPRPATRTQPGVRGGKTKVARGSPVDGRAVAEALAEKKGLPVEILTDGSGEGARLLKLEAHLKSKLVGQDEAVAKVAARIRLAYAGRSERQGPVATFIFLGPQGVGKSEMTRALARFLFGPDNLVHLEMSEFAQEPDLARFIEAIRGKPRSVLLLDEVEKAHVSMADRLLEFLDTADARNTIVVMTSNLGNPEGRPKAGQDAGAATVPLTRTGRAKAGLRRFFRPEFLKRVDDIIAFRPLDEADVRRIARPLLAALVTNVRKTHGVLLRFEPDAEALVIRSGFDAVNGVRELKGAIERLVARPLATLAVSGKLAQHPAWKAVHDEGGIYFLPE